MFHFPTEACLFLRLHYNLSPAPPTATKYFNHFIPSLSPNPQVNLLLSSPSTPIFPTNFIFPLPFPLPTAPFSVFDPSMTIRLTILIKTSTRPTIRRNDPFGPVADHLDHTTPHPRSRVSQKAFLSRRSFQKFKPWFQKRPKAQHTPQPA